MSPKKRATPQEESDTAVVVETVTRKKTKKPPLYKVIFHNDPYTTMEFVVAVLITVFNKSESDAMAVMLHVHTRGAGVAGVYTHEIAETKVQKTMALAQEAQFPLMVTMEPE